MSTIGRCGAAHGRPFLAREVEVRLSVRGAEVRPATRCGPHHPCPTACTRRPPPNRQPPARTGRSEEFSCRKAHAACRGSLCAIIISHRCLRRAARRCAQHHRRFARATRSSTFRTILFALRGTWHQRPPRPIPPPFQFRFRND